MHKLAGYKHGRPYVAKRVKKEYPEAVPKLMRHQKRFKQCRSNGMSRSASLREARKTEHRGMSKREIRRYEGRLGAIARG